MGGGDDAPAAPDYSGVAAASEQSAKYSYDLGKEQLAFYKEQFAQNKETTDSVVDAALRTMDFAQENAEADRDRYENIFQPLEDQLAADAQDYASPERMEKEAGKAEADVAQQMEQARRTAQEKLEQYGVDPSQVRGQAMDLQSRIAEAASQASAGNQARDKTEAIGRALRSEAINVGKGYPGQIAQSYGTAAQGGNQAVNSNLATTQSAASTMGTPTQWQGMGNQAIGQWGNTLNQGYSNALDAYKANQSSSSGFGSVLGAVAPIALSFMGLAEGGEVPRPPPGHAIPMPGGVNTNGSQHDGMGVPEVASPSRGGVPDDVPAALSAGEFVIPKDVVSWKGEEWFQKEIQKARKQKVGAPAQPSNGPPAGQSPQQAIPMPGGA
jgi:hypothetical protein